MTTPDPQDWDDPPLLCHCPGDVPTGSLDTCTVACQQLGAQLDLEDL